MSELFKDFLPDPNIKDESPKTSFFSNFRPKSNQPIKNEFKLYDQPDDKEYLKKVKLEDLNLTDSKFSDFLPGGAKNRNLKVFPRDRDTEIDIGDAFLLGFTDSLRGIKQIAAGKDAKGLFSDETLRSQQERLTQAMQGPGGGLVAAAYFGGAILDPVAWLIPVLRGKNLYQIAKFGAASGALAGALGYVDENSLFDTRSKQALGGALGGAIIAPAAGQVSKFLKLREFKKMANPGAPDIKDIPENKLIKYKLETGAEDVVIRREGQAKAVKKVKGRKSQTGGDTVLQLRKKYKYKTMPVDKSGYPTTLNQNAKNNKSFILRAPREFFKAMLGPYKAAQNIYEKKLGKPAFDYFTKGSLGPELGSGLVGGAYGFSLPEEESNTTTRFGRAVVGFMAGAAGMGAMRSTKLSKFVLGTDDLKLSTYLARGLIDEFKLPHEIKKLKALDLGGLKGKLELDALRIAQKANQLTTDEKKVLYNILEGDIKYPVPVKYLNTLAEEARKNIDDVGQMYVQTGLITEETFLRNIKRYLRRSYASGNAVKLGSDLRARGVVEEISPNEWLARYSREKAFKVDDAGKIVPMDDHRGWELFGKIKNKSGEESGKRPTPELVEQMAKDSKKADQKNLQVRWEYTKQERLGMGEIEDGAFAILETGRMMSQTLPQYKFYADISDLPFVRTNPTSAEIEEKKLVKMPGTIREGTVQPVYGKLANKHVPEEVYNNLVAMNKASQSPKGFFKGYRFLNQIWKSSKTAWNPTVHVNNIVSNLMLTDLVDGNLALLPVAAKAFRLAASGKRSKILEEAENFGVFDVGYVAKELDLLDPRKLPETVYKYDPDKNILENGVNISKFFYKDFVLRDKAGFQKLSDWYRSEDAIFRLALFIDRKNKGYKTADAALDARKSFIDYNISAPGINALRNLPTPFLAYTYRVIPILAETAVVRPWKFAKYAVLGYMANNLGELLGDGDADAERAAFTKERQGRVFGLPFLPHRNIKLPTTDQSRYIDITRYVPGGDVLDLGSGIVPGLPAPLQPSFGIAGDVLFPMVGYDLFREDKIKGQGVSYFDDLKIRAKAVGQRLIPNFPFVPGAYGTERIERARVGEGPLKASDSELLALANAVGIKIRPVDLTRERKVKTFEFSKRVRGIQEQIRIESAKLRNGKIEIEEYNENVLELKNKYSKIRDLYAEALGMPVAEKDPVIIGIPGEEDFQEGTAIKTITDSIKKQTNKLLNIKLPKRKKGLFKDFQV